MHSLLWLCGHLWLFLCISRLKGMAADSTHTQTHADVINSITHTPVNTNEAKTNQFLFMFYLHHFFPLFFFLSSGRLDKVSECLEEKHLQQPQLSKHTDGLQPSLFLCVLLSLFVNLFLSVSLRYHSYCLFFSGKMNK